jgi:hypothetical protein
MVSAAGRVGARLIEPLNEVGAREFFRLVSDRAGDR